MQSKDHLSAADSVAPFGSGPVAWGAFVIGGEADGELAWHEPTEAAALQRLRDWNPHDNAQFRIAPLYASPSPSGSGPTDEDAKRYRWLCEKLGQTELPCLIERITRDYVADYKPSIDAAIDAAIQSKGNQHG